MRNPISTITLLFLTIAFLSACGQKGPLFLPGDPSSLSTIPPAGELQELSEDEEDDEDEDSDPITNRS